MSHTAAKHVTKLDPPFSGVGESSRVMMTNDGGNDTEQEEGGVSSDVLNKFAMGELISFRLPQKSLRRQTSLHPRSELQGTPEEKLRRQKRSGPLPKVKLPSKLQVALRRQ